MKTPAILVALMLSIISSLQAAEPYLQDLGTVPFRTAAKEELDKWRAAGWTLQTETLPTGWAPLGNGGSLELLAETDSPKALRFTGQLGLPQLVLEGSGWLVVSITARRGAISFAGPVYGGPKGQMIGSISLPEMESGPDWLTMTGICRADFPTGGVVVVRISSPRGIEIARIAVNYFASPLDACRSAYELIQRPQLNLIRNGGFEETAKLLPEELASFRGKGWDIGDGENIDMPVGYRPHVSWTNRFMRLVHDRAATYRGENCLLTDFFSGGEFGARADRQYRFSVWARGEGNLALMCAAYGGEKGGHLGNIPVVSGESWKLGPEWKNFQTVVPLAVAGYTQVGLLPIFTASAKVWVDEFAVYELETTETMLTSVDRLRAKLQETLADQVQVGPRQWELIDYLLAETNRLRDALKAGQLSPTDADRVAALEYVTPRAKSEIEFGAVRE